MRQRGLWRADRSRIGRTVFDRCLREHALWVVGCAASGTRASPQHPERRDKWVVAGGAACGGAWVRWTLRRPG
eukprot:5000557-Prymnesium_polylepis.1